MVTGLAKTIERKMIAEMLEEGKSDDEILRTLASNGMSASKSLISQIRMYGDIYSLKDRELYKKLEEREDKHFEEVLKRFESVYNEVSEFKNKLSEMVREGFDEGKIANSLKYYIAMVDQLVKMFQIEFDRYLKLKTKLLSKYEKQQVTYNVLQLNKHTTEFIVQLAKKNKIKILDPSLKNILPQLGEIDVWTKTDGGAEKGTGDERGGNENESSR